MNIRLIFAILSVTLFAACGDDAGTACVSRSDCAATETCVNGACVATPEDGGGRDVEGDSAAPDGGSLDAQVDVFDAPAPADSGDVGIVDAEIADATDAGPDAGPRDAGTDARVSDERVAECEAHPQALYFDGDGFIFTGTQLVTAGNFGLSGVGGGVRVSVTPDDAAQGSVWTTTFAAPSASSLEVQAYPTATRYPFQSGAEAGMDVSGDGRGCSQIDGSFEVFRIHRHAATNVVSSVLVSFEQFCLESPGDVLRGCVKVSM